MSSLRRLLLFVGVGRFRQILIAVLRFDVLPHFGQSFIRNAHRIRTHISDEADEAFLAQFHTFIEALGDHHGALHAEAELAGGILLQLAGGEGRRRVASAFLTIDGTDNPIGSFQRCANFLRVLAVGDFDLFFAFA